MSQRMTTVSVEGAPMGTGLMVYGRASRAEMTAQLRRDAQHEVERHQFILDAPDEAFHVITHTGIHVQRNVEEVTE